MKRIPKTLAAQMAGVTNYKLVFPDVLGRLQEMDISASEIIAVLRDGQGFDGSSIRGFSRIEESDLMAHPDPATFCILPSSITNGERTGLFFCDIRTPGGRPFAGDSRYCLRRALSRAHVRGLTFYVGPECEFFILRNTGKVELIDERGYFEAPGNDLIRRMVRALEAVDITVECGHHEVAPSQYEIDLMYREALRMADQVMLYRYLLRRTAEPEFTVTFMPKPIFGQNGSGMHAHQSVFRGDKNLFFDRRDPLCLSSFARHYIAGLLAHVNQFTLVTNPLFNSYKRIVPGYEAPCYVSWAQRNRSTLVRVPRYRVGKENAVRVELRSPDPSCNPYLAFACMLEAGMRGVDQKLKLPPAVEANVFHMTATQRASRGITMLPETLRDAINLAEQSDFLAYVLGNHILDALLDNKRREWDDHRTQVTEHELNTGLKLY